jgi:DNA-binding MarR family transcriptional regulator
MSAETEAYNVSRTLQVLEMLAERPRSVNRIAEAIGVHPRTARRILKRLAHDGYATREDHVHGRYLLGPRFRELALNAVRHSHDHQPAPRYVEDDHTPQLGTPADDRASAAVVGPDDPVEAPPETATPENFQRARYAFEAACLRNELHLTDQLRIGKIELAALLELAAHGELAQTELGARVGLSRSGAGAMSQRLHDRGLLQRRTDPNDHRRQLITLTADATRALSTPRRPLDNAAEAALAGADPATLDALARLLSATAEAINSAVPAVAVEPAPWAW